MQGCPPVILYLFPQCTSVLVKGVNNDGTSGTLTETATVAHLHHAWDTYHQNGINRQALQIAILTSGTLA